MNQNSQTIRLRVMRPEEFADYQSYFVEDYGTELAANYGLDPAAARTQAREDLETSLPQGPLTPGQDLLCIETADSTLVGYLWHARNIPDRTTFIMDFSVAPEHRSRGYGKQAMAALERLMAAQGVTQIKLRVAYHNPRALALYQEVGYQITGYNMAKNLKAPGS